MSLVFAVVFFLLFVYFVYEGIHKKTGDRRDSVIAALAMAAFTLGAVLKYFHVHP